MDTLFNDILFIGSGLVLTLKLLLGSLFLGLILGALLSILYYNNIGCFFVTRYVSLLRGTPLMLQLSLIYFTAPSLVGFKLSVLSAGIVAFGLNSGAYMAEIFRAGINSVPKGQFEAAKTLDIPTFPMWRDLILPQVIKNILPSFINEIISLLKETSLIGIISGMDIMRMAQILGSVKFTYFMPICIAACYYYSLVLLIESLGSYIEKKQKIKK